MRGRPLGVPYEFVPRNKMKERPVTGMSGYGIHLQPPGTWSDDSSLTLCLADSLCNGFNFNDIAKKFVQWFNENLWTPYGFIFGAGNTTLDAILKLKHGICPLKSGGSYESQNGNGALMRILPVAFYAKNLPVSKQFELTHEISAITHAHSRSKMACGIYVRFAIELLNGKTPNEAYEHMKKAVKEFYVNSSFPFELKQFERILEADISALSEEEIKSSGYVVDTLEASLWCFLNSNSFEEAVLSAVNLGEDTDTTGAVTGGLAGIYYGFDSIPYEWVEKIVRKDDIIALAKRFAHSIR